MVLARIPAISIIALLAALRPGAGQVRGSVHDDAGTRVQGALVELWSPTARLGARLTDARGSFHFPATLADPATSVLVRRIGYAPARASVSGAGELRIVLLPVATTLRPVTVNAVPLCPNDADPTARAIWDRLRRRHAAQSEPSRYWSDVMVQERRARPEELGHVDTLRLTPGYVEAGGGYYEREQRRIADTGYARPYTGLRVPRHDLWEYPRLESFLARHFVDSLFGAVHTFSLDARQPASIVFCPRDPDRPSIEGRLEIDADTTLTKATWRFRTPAPVEEAGGEVLFTRSAASDSGLPLFPSAGRFWRKLVFDYYEEWMEFREWRTCAQAPSHRNCL